VKLHPQILFATLVAEDVRTGKYKQIHIRFPPEPEWLSAHWSRESICLNFGIAREFGGICNIRMDDTNPTKEEHGIRPINHD